ncbi:SpoIIE family protein phosphatase [Paenibacillus koleovorans]|uniref:SpoIIE family protein phosphatase n=1 Tax=Paenibacillus koleovorans TaxID=121608 RepID=UPI000FD82742|nr:SpoIIE family protein phosphatase [Paenibacillus koleovorans]
MKAVTEPGGKSRPTIPDRVVFDTGVTKVMVLASALIVFSIVLIGAFGYFFTEREALKKLKTRDLVTLAESISAKVDARIDKAIETSLQLAHDPAMLEWLAGEERDTRLGEMVHRKTAYLHGQLDYSTTFIVSTLTRHYWSDAGKMIDTVTESDPDDDWFFAALKTGKEVSVNFDYNKELKDTFAFVNTLAGPTGSPVGIVGVGMNLQELSRDFATYKDSAGISLWLIDGEGVVYLSDLYERNGSNIREFVPVEAQKAILASQGSVEESRVIDYENDSGERMDMISYPLRSTDLQLLVAFERREAVAYLQTIKWNTVLAVAISIVAIVFLFYYISRNLANPYKRTLAINQQLEEQVAARTRQLSERNQEMLDSISYAKVLQESVLPKPKQLESLLAEHFIIWRPRDVVGGDFYWTKRIGGTTLVAVGDCTGHGVPGAFMTSLVVSALNRIADSGRSGDPAAMLGELNRLLKSTLHQDDPATSGTTDDGLDIGLCAMEGGRLTYAGAGCSIYRLHGVELETWKGDRLSIGYRRTPADYAYTNHLLFDPQQTTGANGAAPTYYMTTDGFADQNGGERDFSFGKKRFAEMLTRYGELALGEQKAAFLRELEAYMGGERQRDDITVLAFRTQP